MKTQKTKAKSLYPISEIVAPIFIIFSIATYPLMMPLSLVKAEGELNNDPAQGSEVKTEENKQEETKDTDGAEKPKEEAKSESTPDAQDELQADKEGIKEEQTPSTPDNIAESANETLENKNDAGQDSQPQDPEPDTESNPEPNVSEPTQEQTATEISNSNTTNSENESQSTSNTGENNVGEKLQPEELPSENLEEIQQIQSNGNEAYENLETEQNPIAPNTGLVGSASDLPISSAAIVAGSANATSTIINEENTNIVSNNYEKVTTNIEGVNNENINLLEQFENLQQATPQSDKILNDILEVINNNSAIISNVSEAIANSGNNSIDGNDIGSSTIETGNANATANILNIINQNFVGNSWLFEIINIFGDWNGDLIVPGKGLLNLSGGETSKVDVTNENKSDIKNSAVAESQTGENTIDQSSTSSIITGQSQSSADVTTIANTNVVKNNWFLLMINNMGSWTGKVFGWNNEKNDFQNLFSYDFNSNGKGVTNPLASSISVHNTNDAVIDNSAIAKSSTGGNSISDSENALIKTGDASSQANIFNMVNTNIVGNNWLFGIVNIFGKWNGDVIFAYPDLAIDITGPNSLHSGEKAEYKVSITNKGQADADNILIDFNLPSQLSYASDNSGYQVTQSENHLKWNIPQLKAGENMDFTVTTNVDNSSGNELEVQMIGDVSSVTEEPQLDNNSFSYNAYIYSSQNDGYFYGYEKPDSKIHLTRSTSSNSTLPGGSAQHFINIKNTGKSILYNIEIKDEVKNPRGESISTYTWQIPKLEKREQIQIQYTLAIGDSAQTGTYSYAAIAAGWDQFGNYISSNNSRITLAMYVPNKNSSASTSGEIQSSDPQVAASDTSQEELKIEGLTTKDTAGKNFPFRWALLITLLIYFYVINQKTITSFVKNKSFQKI